MENNNRQKRPSPPINFHFVTDQDPSEPSQIRRHVARERWKQRKAPGLARFTRTGPRRLVSASTLKSLANSSPKSENTPPVPRVNISNDISIDFRHGLSKRQHKWKLSTVPTSSGYYPGPYQSLGHAELDPFNGIRLSWDDQQLLHHWIDEYAYHAFGQPQDPIFLPLSNAYVPIDLSNEANTHATLAHSASHLSQLRGEGSPITALIHKVAAIKLVNEALNDPEIAISDGTIAAVLRLSTFERFWGTEEAWKLHQKGLNQLVKQRGGINSLRGNWRLEMRVLLAPTIRRAPIMSKPKLISNSVNSPQGSTASSNSKFINVFSDITIPGEDIACQYPAIGRATEFLKSLKIPAAEYFSYREPPEKEVERLMCLVYISFACKHTMYSRFDLKLFNDFLDRTEQMWCNSTSTLRWLLTESVGKGPGGLNSQRASRLAEIATLLNLSACTSLEESYLGILVPDGAEAGGLLSPVAED